MRRIRSVLVVAVASLASAACGAGTIGDGASSPAALAPLPAERLETVATYDVPYTSALPLDVYRPTTDGPWPTVVFFHGGEEVKERWETYARDIAAQGVVVFAPQWRATPAELDLAPLGALEDAACAMRFARDNAAAHGGSSDRVLAAGFSLGGNLAAVLAMVDGSAFPGDCLTDADLSAVSDGFVGVDAVYDFEALVRDSSRQEREASAFEPYNTFALVGRSSPRDAVILTGLVASLREEGERLRDVLVDHGWDVTYVNQPLSHSGYTSLRSGSSEAIARVAHGEPYVPDAA